MNMGKKVMQYYSTPTKRRVLPLKERERVSEANRGVVLLLNMQHVRLVGSYRCWFVKKYCWLVCVREKYYFS